MTTHDHLPNPPGKGLADPSSTQAKPSGKGLVGQRVYTRVGVLLLSDLNLSDSDQAECQIGVYMHGDVLERPLNIAAVLKGGS
jgi:hypothetical protein